MKKWYKIVEKDKNTIKTLFHGLNGSRAIPKHKWLTAIKKLVSDGPNSSQYLSGWHILETQQEAVDYLKNFRTPKNRVVVPCVAKGIRKKSHSRDKVFLADKIKLI